MNKIQGQAQVMPTIGQYSMSLEKGIRAGSTIIIRAKYKIQTVANDKSDTFLRVTNGLSVVHKANEGARHFCFHLDTSVLTYEPLNDPNNDIELEEYDV